MIDFVDNFFFTDQKCKKKVSKDAQCSETEFLVFELWSIFYFTFVEHSWLTRIYTFFNVREAPPAPPKPPVFVSGLMGGGEDDITSPNEGSTLRPRMANAFGLNPPSQLNWFLGTTGSESGSRVQKSMS